MKLTSLAIVCGCLLLSACATRDMQGSFIPHSYIDPKGEFQGELIGHVSGTSSQTLVLYIFPVGDAPSLDEAMDDAMSKIPGTKYLTNISIDDRTVWGIGYSREIIELDADARN
ncbi:hypothetical protein QQF73_11370 [Marinobacter sp. M216]|uniref:Lipoprotein n=1 Tax=Marinobacter albus TaxID=3030833 RepID=A0ABT7HFF2_9GAMM|nr:MULTISPECIES: hypothetical protein [unclassified Marinobacter]MBW7469511.1 hypothetical protein [Marinobacter sp. F4218]MDK9558220.1 hypothetical protein [Marinobacter sp. M216]